MGTRPWPARRRARSSWRRSWRISSRPPSGCGQRRCRRRGRPCPGLTEGAHDMRHPVTVGILTSLAVTALLGTGPSVAQNDPTLRVAIQADPATLDPALTDDPTGTALLQDVYTPLLDVDSRGVVKPLAAKEWSVSPDGRTFRFRLRDGLRFQGGQAVTATDVKYSLDRLASAK